jgi:ribonuclease R
MPKVFNKSKVSHKKGAKNPSSHSDETPTRSGLSAINVLEVTELSSDGELFGIPVIWDNERREPPRILLVQGVKGQSPSVGQRVLAKMLVGNKKHYSAEIIRVLPEKVAMRVLGVFQPMQKGGLLQPVNRKQKHDFFLPPDQCDKVKAGELVLAELQPRRRDQKMGLQEAKVVEILGDINNPRCFSLIAIHHQEIPSTFSEAAMAEAGAAHAPTPDGRTDLRDIPLITIDGQDARDFDDAIFAEADGDGWHLIVAIADVAHYVKPNSPLDQEALNRGNSVYFPDRVVPMLPEALSNGLCSLKPDEDRYCLAVHLWINSEGLLKNYEFVRGIMRSHARMVYEQVQQLWDAQDPEWLPRLTPIYGAYQSLLKFREERGALELDLPEFKIQLGEDGKVTEVSKRTRLDSHKLIEEFMICANVAAAEAIEEHKTDGIFRIHENPSLAKVDELRSFLKTMDYSLSTNAAAKQFNKLISKAEGTPEATLISSAILRSQMQAYYSPRNKGHFGLGLEKYCHFTSPIRRYADLVVHRALITMLGLQERSEKRVKHEDKEAQDIIGSVADHISQTERRAMLAEREANDRYVTAYMANHLRDEFEGYITSVGSFGLFVTLKETGASGILRMADLGRDYFVYDEKTHSLTGRDRGRKFQLGQRVVITLQAADVALGSLRFGLVSADRLPDIKKADSKNSKFPRTSFGKDSKRPERDNDRKKDWVKKPTELYSEIPDFTIKPRPPKASRDDDKRPPRAAEGKKEYKGKAKPYGTMETLPSARKDSRPSRPDDRQKSFEGKAKPYGTGGGIAAKGKPAGKAGFSGKGKPSGGAGGGKKFGGKPKGK